LGGSLILLLWLALMPFVTAAGTTHKIFINALLHVAPLAAAILLLAASLDKSFRRGIILSIVGLLILGLSFSQFITGFVLNPYRTAPKWAQTVPVEVGVPSTILKLDPASAECIEKTKAALSNADFKPGDDILALYGLPGLVYAVGGVSPERPWFFNFGLSGHEENLGALLRMPRDRILKAYIFLNDKDDWAMSQLSKCDVDLKDQYQQIERVVVPFRNQKVEILKPLN
jgi:hypothetical protein